MSSINSQVAVSHLGKVESIKKSSDSALVVVDCKNTCETLSMTNGIRLAGLTLLFVAVVLGLTAAGLGLPITAPIAIAAFIALGLGLVTLFCCLLHDAYQGIQKMPPVSKQSVDSAPAQISFQPQRFDQTSNGLKNTQQPVKSHPEIEANNQEMAKR